MTKQEAFNAAWNGLKAQGFQQTPEGCLPGVRRMDTGCLACAMGHVQRVYGKESTNEFGISAFLGAMIAAHDDATGPEDVERRMRAVAARFELAIPADDGFAAFKAKILAPITEDSPGWPA